MSGELTSRAAPFRMRPRRLVVADPLLPRGVPVAAEATIVGGGIAGMSAAVVLAERGVAVTVLEAAEHLGGRLGAWPERLPDGIEQYVEHGFHAFFRHYYTWRSILRRVDPQLSFLAPVRGYPVISATYPAEDLSGLPAAPPLNLLALALRSKSLTARELTRANPDAGRALLAYDRATTTAQFDDTDAAAFLDSLGMSERTRSMLFEAFARSFFCNQGELSAAELVAMFHYYFLGNPEGIGFDVTDTDYATAIWNPLREYLDSARGRRANRDTGHRCLARRAELAHQHRHRGHQQQARRACFGPRRPAHPARGLTCGRGHRACAGASLRISHGGTAVRRQ